MFLGCFLPTLYGASSSKSVALQIGSVTLSWQEFIPNGGSKGVPSLMKYMKQPLFKGIVNQMMMAGSKFKGKISQLNAFSQNGCRKVGALARDSVQ